MNHQDGLVKFKFETPVGFFLIIPIISCYCFSLMLCNDIKMFNRPFSYPQHVLCQCGDLRNPFKAMENNFGLLQQYNAIDNENFNKSCTG